MTKDAHDEQRPGRYDHQLACLLTHTPSAALGAIVVHASVRLVEASEFRRLAAFRRREFLLALGCGVGVLALGILYGVLLAVALSVAELLTRVARPHDAVEGMVPGLAGMHDIDDYPNARTIPGLLIYRYDGRLHQQSPHPLTERQTRVCEQGPHAE